MTLNPCPRLARAFAAARRAGSGKSPIRPARAALALARDALARHEAAKEKAAQARAAFPGLCDVIRRRVSELRESILESREERAALARGNGGETWHFYSSDAKLKAAFCEGAGLSVYPE